MADLTKKDIRQGVVTRLRASTIAPLATATIYDSRAAPVQDSETGVVIVTTWSERQEQFADGQPNFKAITTLLMDCHITADVDPSDPASGAVLTAALDDMDEAITVTLFTDPTWVQLFSKFLRNEHRSFIEMPKGVMRGKAQVTIELETTRVYEPDGAYYGNLEGVDVTTRPIDPDTGDPSTDIEIEQEIDLPVLP